MGVREDFEASLRELQRQMNEPPPPVRLRLFVPPYHFAMGEEWVRRVYCVGTDVEIIESRPIPVLP